MGSSFSQFLSPHLWKEDEPDASAPIQYRPEFGFEDVERKPRVLVATKQEMDSAGMFEDERDFCSHIRLEYYGCMRRNTLSWWKCKGIDNELWDCYSMNRIHDMKEFERERRLNARERRIHEKEARASLEE